MSVIRRRMFSPLVVGVLVVLATFCATLVALDFYLGAINRRWIEYSPSVSSLAGNMGRAGATATYKLIGTTVFFQMTIVVTSNGTANAALKATLPYRSRSNVVVAGRDVDAGPMLQGVIQKATSEVLIFTYHNGYPGGDNKTFYVSGAYEAE